MLKEKRNLSVYFGALENEDLLEGREEDSRKLRNFRVSGIIVLDTSYLLYFIEDLEKTREFMDNDKTATYNILRNSLWSQI